MELKKYQIPLLFGFAVIGAFSSVIYVLNFNHKGHPDLHYNPHHAANGVDTVFAADSTFIIKVGIIKEYHNDIPVDDRSPADKL